MQLFIFDHVTFIQFTICCCVQNFMKIRWFLPRDVMQARPMSSCSVCPSVCLSRSWIMSKRINISSNYFHHRVATLFYFFRSKRHSNIPTGTPSFLTGASNASGVGRKRDSKPISGLTACVNAATGRCCKRGRRWTATVSQVVHIAGSNRRCSLPEKTTKCLWQEASTLRQRQQSSAFNCTQW